MAETVLSTHVWPDNLKSIVTQLGLRGYVYEALDMLTYNFANALDYYQEMLKHPSIKGSLMEIDVLLKLANAYGEVGKFKKVTKCLQTVRERLDEVSYSKGERDALFIRLRYPPNPNSIDELQTLAGKYGEENDFESQFRVLEAARVLHTQQPLNSFSIGEDIHETMIRLAERTGDRHSSVILQFRKCDLLSGYGHFGPAVELRETLLQSEWCHRLPYLQQYHKRQVEDYLHIGNGAKAVPHATKYIDYCNFYEDSKAKSKAATLSVEASLAVVRGSSEVKIIKLETLRLFLLEMIGKDSQDGFDELMVEKNLLLAEVLKGLVDPDDDDTLSTLSSTLNQAEKALEDVSPDDKSRLWQELRFLRTTLLASGDRVESTGSTPPATAKFDPSSSGETKLSNDTVMGRLWYPFIEGVKRDSVEELCQAFAVAQQEKRRIDNGGHLLESFAILTFLGAFCYYVTLMGPEDGHAIWEMAKIESRETGLGIALQYLDQAMKVEEKMRAELPIEHTVDALAARQSIIANRAFIPELALMICCEIGDNSLIWLWVQRSKAQGLASMMGRSSNADSNSNDLREERKLKMEDPPPVSLQDLRWMAQAENQRIVFVDWAAPITPYHPYILLTVHFEGHEFEFANIKTARVALSKDDVEKWKSRYLNPRRMKDDNALRDLSIIDGLVKPLGEFTGKDDLLILSPTASLYNIPLHALKVDGDILLQRNPVVYIPSFSVLRQCLKSLEAPKKDLRQRPDWKAAVMSAYQELPDETQAVADAMQGLAQSLGTHAVTENDLTLAVFQTMAERANLIHFHGHGEFNASNTLEHSLILGRNGAEKVSGDTKDDGAESATKEEISIREIMQLHLRSPHVTLIACLSGLQQVNEEGDEPLGLVPAFLLAGATSIVSTLWTIRSEDGRKFTEAFYSYFLAGPAEGALGPVVNLARALQSSVLLIQSENTTCQPYHWAGFVLYGAWFCGSRPQTRTASSM